MAEEGKEGKEDDGGFLRGNGVEELVCVDVDGGEEGDPIVPGFALQRYRAKDWFVVMEWAEYGGVRYDGGLEGEDGGGV